MPIKDSGSQITIDEIVSSFIDDKQSPIQLSPAQPSFQQSASATVVIYKQKFLKAPIITNYKDVFAGLKDNSLKRVNITKKRSPAWEIFRSPAWEIFFHAQIGLLVRNVNMLVNIAVKLETN